MEEMRMAGEERNDRESLEKEMIDRLTSGIFQTLSDLPLELREQIKCECGSREFSFIERLRDHVMLEMNVETGDIEYDAEYPEAWETAICCSRCGKEME